MKTKEPIPLKNLENKDEIKRLVEKYKKEFLGKKFYKPARR